MQYVTVGDQIKKYRKIKGLTQQQLGARLGISQALIGQYETGKRNPKTAQLERIARALEITVDDILEDVDIQSMVDLNGFVKLTKAINEELGVVTPFNPNTVQSFLDKKKLTEEEMKEVEKFVDFLLSKRKEE